MSTQPLPIAERTSALPSRGTRALELIAGLAGGGLLLLGVGLLVLQLVVPQVIDDADGPGWGPALAHLLVGGAAETGRAFRGRLSVPLRLTVATVTILAVIAVLVLIWWR